jgi:sugar lactone lactonase YvrE
MDRNPAIALADVLYIGEDLSRPECILAQANGTLWVADDRSGVLRIGSDGGQTRIGNVGGTPNGIAMDRDGSFLIANIESGLVQRLRRDGTHETVLSEIDGQPLGAVNFVLFDSRWRLWVTVSTRAERRRDAISSPRPDGYVMLVEDGQARIVAEGLFFANEVRLSADETVLYAAETTAGRVTRYDVGADGSLSNRQPFGPDPLWDGALTDGVVVDAAGCVWVTEITRNALVRIAPDGTASLMLEDRDGGKVRAPTSLTFAGPDLRDALIGSLGMDRLPRFRSDTAGLEPPHWRLG